MRLDEIEVGSKDQRGRDILGIYWSTKDYIVFKHPWGLSPHFSDDNATATQQRHDYHQIGPTLSHVNALRSGKIFNAESVDRAIARAIAQCLEGEIESSRKTLEGVTTRLQNLRNLQGRLEYQGAALLMTVVVGIFFYLLTLGPSSSGLTDSQPVLGFERVMSVALFGALGGFLSVSMGIRKLEIDPDSDSRINYVSGASRIIIAIIGSIFVYLGVVSDLVLGGLQAFETEEGLLALAMASGFSETLVPNLFRKIATTDGGGS